MSSTEAPPTASRPRTARSAKAAKAAKAPPPTKAIEMLDALKAASRDKEIELDRLISALEEAVATAARKVYKVREISARFDPATGGLTAWTPYRIVEQKTKPEVPPAPAIDPDDPVRSEEHTSELQSLITISYAVFCLKKKNKKKGIKDECSRLLEASTMKSRRGFAIQRLMNAMRQAHADGCFFFLMIRRPPRSTR